MAFPDSLKALGEQIEAGAEEATDPALFEAYDVFSAELANIFARPWLAIDHASRLGEDGCYVRAEIGSRSVVVVREAEDKIHAMRNACLHAGYRICEEDGAKVDHLYCIYHGWSYSLDGMLTDPLLRPDMKDRSRFRLQRYPMRIERGLILVDPSTVGPEAPLAADVELGAIPNDLGERPVGRRLTHKTTMNWKKLHQFLWAEPGLAFGNGGADEAIDIGPLSRVLLKNGDAILMRLVPRYPGHTDIELVELPQPGSRRNGAGDPVGDVLRDRGEAVAAMPLGRAFIDWYWPHLAPAAEA